MFDTLPFIGHVWKARRRYSIRCKAIDGMKEVPEAEREALKSAALQELVIETTEWITKKRTDGERKRDAQ